jgi:prevent-host-death family protein
MRFITARELRSSSANLWEELVNEKEIVVTLNGRPVALLTPVDDSNFDESLQEVRRAKALSLVRQLQLKSMAAGTDKITLDEINKEIRQARRQQK